MGKLQSEILLLVVMWQCGKKPVPLLASNALFLRDSRFFVVILKTTYYFEKLFSIEFTRNILTKFFVACNLRELRSMKDRAAVSIRKLCLAFILLSNIRLESAKRGLLWGEKNGIFPSNQ